MKQQTRPTPDECIEYAVDYLESAGRGAGEMQERGYTQHATVVEALVGIGWALLAKVGNPPKRGKTA